MNNLEILFNASEETFPLPAAWKSFYGPFGFPETATKDRPYVTSNFVTGIDGRASFIELHGKAAGGGEVSRSDADKWLFNFLLAHHDAGIVGAGTLLGEAGSDGLGWDLHIEPEELAKYRRDALGFKKQVVIVLSGSGELDLNFRMFNSEKVEAWIVTSTIGAEALRPQIATRGGKTKLIDLGGSAKIDLREMLRILRQEHGIKTLHCLGGPSLHGQFLEDGLLDESFLTISTQVLGASTDPKIERPTAFGKASFVPSSAPWFRTISIHHEPPYHVFLRLRHEGTRQFKD